MKILKNFTDGLAILLAVLILIYCVSLYVKFKPDEDKLEDGNTKISLFLEQSQSNKDYLRMAFAVVLSALIGMILRKRPEFGIISSLVALSYVLILKSNGSLSKRPNVIIILCFCHAAGAIVYAAASDRKNGKFSCLAGCIVSALLGFCTTVYTAVYQYILKSTADVVEFLSENRLDIPMKYRIIPGFVDLIKRKYDTDGNVDASEIMYSIGRTVKLSSMKNAFVNSLDAEQFSTYLRLAILLFATIILCLALGKRFKLLCAFITSIPFIYAIVELQRDMISTLAMPILVFTLGTAICGIVAYEQSGLISVEEYENTANLEEEAEAQKNESGNADDSEEIYYT